MQIEFTTIESYETKNIKKPQSEFTLNLGQIPEGMYFLKLKTEKNKFITKKIIKI